MFFAKVNAGLMYRGRRLPSRHSRAPHLTPAAMSSGWRREMGPGRREGGLPVTHGHVVVHWVKVDSNRSASVLSGPEGRAETRRVRRSTDTVPAAVGHATRPPSRSRRERPTRHDVPRDTRANTGYTAANTAEEEGRGRYRWRECGRARRGVGLEVEAEGECGGTPGEGEAVSTGVPVLVPLPGLPSLAGRRSVLSFVTNDGAPVLTPPAIL